MNRRTTRAVTWKVPSKDVIVYPCGCCGSYYHCYDWNSTGCSATMCGESCSKTMNDRKEA